MLDIVLAGANFHNINTRRCARVFSFPLVCPQCWPAAYEVRVSSCGLVFFSSVGELLSLEADFLRCAEYFHCLAQIELFFPEHPFSCSSALNAGH